MDEMRDDYRGYSILFSLSEHGGEWRAQAKIGVFDGDVFMPKLGSIDQRVTMPDGGLALGMHVISAAKATIDRALQ